MNRKSLWSVLSVLVMASLILSACGSPATRAPTQAPAAQPTAPLTPDPFKAIDSQMQSAMSGSIAHNAPSSMHLDDTVVIQVLVSPSISPEELQNRITENGPVVTAGLTITPKMKAELIPANPDAFHIQAVHDNAVQLLTSTEPTEWKWLVTANQEGAQLLYLTVYRLIDYGGESWRQVTSYRDVINVDVTLPQRLAGFDWKWLVGIVVTIVLGSILAPIFVQRWNKRHGG